MSGAGAVAGGNGNYCIEVADFGPIRRAAVDLRPLTVFAGPSNTGKSTWQRWCTRCTNSILARPTRLRRPNSMVGTGWQLIWQSHCLAAMNFRGASRLVVGGQQERACGVAG